MSKFAKFLTTISVILMMFTQVNASQRDVIIDADTANEVDDLFAVVRALIEPSWNVLALNATQWQVSQWATQDTMEDSHRLNQMLVGHMQLSVPTKRGGHRRMYDWGDQAVHSAAAYEIINQAHKKRQKKLLVVALGALTNVASALFIDPSIENKIEVFWLGSTYDFSTGMFGTTDFNSVMDTQALHRLLRSKVELNVIPINVAAAMTFDFSATDKQLRDTSELSNLLLSRWRDHIDGGRKIRTIWDLALITAIIHPQWATIKTVQLSNSFGNKRVNFYQTIDDESIRAEFFETILTFLKAKN